MLAEVRTFPEAGAASRALAGELAAEIRRCRTAGQHGPVLGLPTGGTPLRLYQEWGRLHREEGLTFAGVTAFNLDEYWPAPAGASFADFMAAHLYAHVDLPPAQAHILDGRVAAGAVAAECARYEALIRQAGGIDLLLLGLGVNGHVAFNEPGSAPDSRTRRVDLAPDTRALAAAANPAWAPCAEALTMGIGTILEARRIVVMAFGAAKADAVGRALRGAESADCPASFLRRHPRVAWLLDPASAARI